MVTPCSLFPVSGPSSHLWAPRQTDNPEDCGTFERPDSKSIKMVWDWRDKWERKKKKPSKTRRLQLSCTTPPVRCVGIYRRVRAKTPTMLSFMKKTVSNGQEGKKTSTCAVMIISFCLSITTLKAPCGTNLHIFSSHLRLQWSSLTWINYTKNSL